MNATNKRALDDEQFKDCISLAWARVNGMDAVDRKYKQSPAYQHPEDVFIGTVLSALKAGMQMGGPRGLECVADAYVMLLQRVQMIRGGQA
jgi:hypothetical protein